MPKLFDPQVEQQIERYVKEGLNTRQIYQLLNINNWQDGKPSFISEMTVNRRVRKYIAKYRPWELQPLPQDTLMKFAKELERKARKVKE